MPSVFLDADVIVDVLAERQPFYWSAARVMSLVEERQVTAFTSSLIFANLTYLLRRSLGRDSAIAALRKLHTLVAVLPVDERSIDFALGADFTDFEDALQYHTAVRHQIPYLLTRSTKDYRGADTGAITVCTPEEYLGLWLSTQTPE